MNKKNRQMTNTYKFIIIIINIIIGIRFREIQMFFCIDNRQYTIKLLFILKLLISVNNNKCRYF